MPAFRPVHVHCELACLREPAHKHPALQVPAQPWGGGPAGQRGEAPPWGGEFGGGGEVELGGLCFSEPALLPPSQQLDQTQLLSSGAKSLGTAGGQLQLAAAAK